jgi:hypothetical protein
MTPTEKAIRDFCGHHADWWPSTTQVQEMLALAQPVQEPMHPDIKKLYEDYFDKCFREFSATQPAPVQEPVAILKGIDEYGPVVDWYRHWVTVPIGTKFYTTPPQRTWVGLTPKEVAEIVIYPMNKTDDLVRIIETKLKEKNEH